MRTLGWYLDAVFSVHRDVSSSTLQQYGIAVRLFEAWSGGGVPLDKLDEGRLSEFLRDYGASGRSPETVRAKRQAILRLWRSAAEDGYCRWPAARVRSPRIHRKAVQAWTIDEVRSLLVACRGLKRWHKCGLRRSVWFDLAIRLAWDTGLRLGDLARLRVSDVRPDGTGVVTQSKTGRVVAFSLSPSTMVALRLSLISVPRQLCVPWTGSHETFGLQVRRLVAAAGIRAGTWKWLRRSSATDVEAQVPGSAWRQLGHAPGSRVAEVSYIDQSIVGAGSVRPREL